jgi:threonine dehydratase
VSVNDRQTIAAMQVALDEFGLVVEPGGAVALAAALADVNMVRGRTVVAVLSGANVDRDVYARLIAVEAQ